jgi:hypothetical protein
MPLFSQKFKEAIQDPKTSLRIARIITIIFTIITIVVGLYQDSFGGVLGMIVTWGAALLSLCGVGIVLGLFPRFKYSDGKVVMISLGGGLAAFALTKLTDLISFEYETALPVVTTLVIYILGGYINKKKGIEVSPQVNDMLNYISLNEDDNRGKNVKDQVS